jgi:hypothetical protein
MSTYIVSMMLKNIFIFLYGICVGLVLQKKINKYLFCYGIILGIFAIWLCVNIQMN